MDCFRSAMEYHADHVLRRDIVFFQLKKIGGVFHRHDYNHFAYITRYRDAVEKFNVDGSGLRPAGGWEEGVLE